MSENRPRVSITRPAAPKPPRDRETGRRLKVYAIPCAWKVSKTLIIEAPSEEAAIKTALDNCSAEHYKDEVGSIYIVGSAAVRDAGSVVRILGDRLSLAHATFTKWRDIARKKVKKGGGGEDPSEEIAQVRPVITATPGINPETLQYNTTFHPGATLSESPWATLGNTTTGVRWTQMTNLALDPPADTSLPDE